VAGHVLDELEAQQIVGQTYFFFGADNGYHLGQHRLPPGKREIFQHDINVALIASGALCVCVVYVWCGVYMCGCGLCVECTVSTCDVRL
jgi:hypothetical protein